MIAEITQSQVLRSRSDLRITFKLDLREKAEVWFGVGCFGCWFG